MPDSRNTEEILSENLDTILHRGTLFEKQMERIKEETKNKACPWHRRKHPGHKNNFGLMGECKDCMDELKKGRCTIDVCNFDLDVYWNVRNFWLKVDIQEDQNECWPWVGGTKRNGTESVAYMPSPFHSGRTQSAPRVAFWLSRGYTGKFRVFHHDGCEPNCCNPLHLYMKELASMPKPTAIEKVNLIYGNIFEHAKTDIENKPSYFK